MMTQVTSKPRTATRTIKADATIAKAVDQAREAAEYRAGDFGVGEHVGTIAEGERVLTHLFECPHPGYRGWRWAVTMSRALRGRNVTVNEVVLVPGEDSLLAPPWVPWRDRVRAGDIAAGTLMPTADNDPRLEPGYTGGELAADEDPAEWAATRAVASELGLGRERLLSREGRDSTAERWLAGEGGPGNATSHHAPASCVTCGYFVRLQHSLGRVFLGCARTSTLPPTVRWSTSTMVAAATPTLLRSVGGLSSQSPFSTPSRLTSRCSTESRLLRRGAGLW
ncbi:hypothetical protein JCM18909_3006 [Cutibacterium acnes JCM 18909]|nr:hypothetical protein JCM18909_3006 [Cutibacterium acnes JCM 18909]